MEVCNHRHAFHLDKTLTYAVFATGLLIGLLVSPCDVTIAEAETPLQVGKSPRRGIGTRSA